MRAALTILIALVVSLPASRVAAQPEGDRVDDAVEDDGVAAARRAFVQGAEHAKETRWGDALERFEASARLRPHAGTTYNIGICHRALGRYALAQATFRRALAEHQASGETELAPSLVANTHGYLDEIDRVLASFDVTLAPAAATITVDGRPLEVVDDDAAVPTLVAGTEPPGPGRKPPRGRFRLVLDPGPHVFVLSHAGYGEVVVRESIRPGAKRTLDLTLARLPARLAVRSSEALAAVSIDGVDVGTAPIAVERPAGRYRIRVDKDGFEPYDAEVVLRSAEESSLVARLRPEEPAIYEQWWLWTSIGAAVATAAVITYFVVRPEPQRPPLDGGGLDWTIQVP
ncbi:MAG: PEGA domain-containing protein [Myxococcales bacterium]|nr:PEGA domain-containing protein [Myxococcales bacterium]